MEEKVLLSGSSGEKVLKLASPRGSCDNACPTPLVELIVLTDSVRCL